MQTVALKFQKDLVFEVGLINIFHPIFPFHGFSCYMSNWHCSTDQIYPLISLSVLWIESLDLQMCLASREIVDC